MGEVVKFRSGNDTIVGVLSRPEGVSGPVPLVVMAGGWCYVKEVVMPHYARYFNSIGCAALYFDYRNFGESSGEPRQHADPWMQIEDYRNALSFAETLDGVDHSKTGVWGISYSGGHVLVLAAIDPRPAFAMSLVPVIDGFRTMRRGHGEVFFGRLNKAVLDDRRRRFEGKPGGVIPMSTLTPESEISTWPFAGTYNGFIKIKNEEAPRHEHRNTIESVELLMNYNAASFCHRIVDTPVLMTVTAADIYTHSDSQAEAFNAITNPNKDYLVVGGVDHMSIYTDLTHLAKVGEAQARWLEKTLAAL